MSVILFFLCFSVIHINANFVFHYPSRILSYWTPANVVVSPTNQHIFIVDMSFNRVLHLSSESIYLSTLSLPMNQSITYSPIQLAIDSTGFLYAVVGATGSFALIYKFRTTDDQLIEQIPLTIYVPTALTVSPVNDDIYIATMDTNNTSIYVINKTGQQINKFDASKFSPPLTQPTALTLDKRGQKLYVANRDDSTTGRVYVVDSQTGQQLQFYTNSNIYRPTAVIVDVYLNVYIADMATNCIVALTWNGTLIRTYKHSLYSPQGLTFSADSNLLLSDTLNNQLVLFDIRTAQVLNAYSSSDPLLISPRLVLLLNNGDIYVNSLNDNGEYSILKKLTITNSSANVTQIINPKPHFGFPVGLAVDRKDQIYVTDADIPYGYIHVFASNATEINRISTINPQLKNPNGISIDIEGNIYVADSGNARVVKLLTNGSLVTRYKTTPPLQYPYDVKVREDGIVYISDAQCVCIYQLSNDGQQLAVIQLQGQTHLTSPFLTLFPSVNSSDPDLLVTITYPSPQINQYTSNGTLVGTYTMPASASTSWNPYTSVIDEKHHQLIVTDSYGRMMFFFLLSFTVDAQSLSPFDVRIDHHKIDTSNDLIINTPHPRFSWKIRVSDHKLQRNVQQEAYQMQLQSIKLNQREKTFEWDSERVLSSQSIHVPYTGPTDLLPSTYYRFRVRVWVTDSGEPSEWIDWIRFRTPIFNLHEYFTENSTAIWIGSLKMNMNELRKEFVAPNMSPVKSAIVYISGIGYYEFYLNGDRVDPSRKLDPGWTTYEYRTLFASFDVTPNITVGANAVGVKLGNGWYSAEQRNKPGFDQKGPPDVGPPRLLFTLIITFANGEQMEIVSDQTWTGREGSIKHDSVYNGEIYDSRNDRPNWARAGFNDSLSAWITAELMPSPLNSSLNGSLVLQDMPPIRAGLDALHFEVPRDNFPRSYLTREDIADIKGAKLTDGAVLKPVAMWSSDSGIRTFDFGQNMAGWCRFKFRGPSGFGVYMRHGEVLTQPLLSNNRFTRNIYTENLGTATASDTYILRGDPVSEIYEPTFTIHGFRYVSIFGSPNSLTMDDIECPFVHSETTLTGHFATSNPIVNQIQHNIQWGQLSNIMSLPTDCPQRDERHGYLGDAALSIDEALYNFDLIKFYHNFLNLIVDVQQKNGAVPDFVPGNIYDIDPNWGTALATLTWQIYRHYNDVQTLKDYYDPTVAYVRYLQNSYNTTGLANFTFRYGDWVPAPPHPMTNVHLTTSFGFLHDVYTLINISQILGKKEEADVYSALYQKLAEEFHRVFYNTSSNCYADGLQAAQVFALALPGVVPANVREAAINCLVTDIQTNGNHLTTGIVSTAQFYPVLSDNGHHDLALEMVSSITYPSYGYMFNNPYENATTIWERWNTGFTGPGMNSRNHIMFGSVGAWFYSHLAGIDF